MSQAGAAVRRAAVRLGDLEGQFSTTSTGARSSAGTGCTSATSTDGSGQSTPTLGTGLYSWDTGDGNIKGFPFPDRRNGDVYFVTTIDLTTGRVSAVTDTGAAFSNKWSLIAQKPSTPLLSTATNFLYVGVEQAITGAGVSQYASSTTAAS